MSCSFCDAKSGILSDKLNKIGIQESTKHVLSDLETNVNDYRKSIERVLYCRIRVFFKKFFSDNSTKIVIIQAITELTRFLSDKNVHLCEHSFLTKIMDFIVEQQADVLDISDKSIQTLIKKEGLKAILMKHFNINLAFHEYSEEHTFHYFTNFFQEAGFEISKEDISITCPSIDVDDGAGAGAGSGASSATIASDKHSDKARVLAKDYECKCVVLCDGTSASSFITSYTYYNRRLEISNLLLTITENVNKFLTINDYLALSEAKKKVYSLISDNDDIKINLGRSVDITLQDIFDSFFIDKKHYHHVCSVLEMKDV